MTEHRWHAASPIERGWVSTGGTGARNYDEFASAEEVTEAIAAARQSVLAIEMPDRTPEAVAAGRTFTESLDDAAAELSAALLAGRLAPFPNLVAAYRISDGKKRKFRGVFCMVETKEIASGAGEPGKVIRNEDVFAEKVVERTALTRRLEALLSPVLLLTTGPDDVIAEFNNMLRDIDEGWLGDPTITDRDQAGRLHEVWAVSADGPHSEWILRVLGCASYGELVVADGNHRSLSAQQAGLDKFLAVITSAPSVRIASYDRLIHQLDLPVPDLLEQLANLGVTAEKCAKSAAPKPRVPILYVGGAAYRLDLSGVAHPSAEKAAKKPADESTGSVAARLDHAVVERVLFGEVLGMEPGDKRVSYVGGDYGRSWLVESVDRGDAVAAVMVAPVSVDDFVAVNLAREKMPRKSTWFVPKARAGLVVADVPTRAEAPSTAPSTEPGRPTD